jgi:predicted lipoprotein with Yx(FWY)xxD motif
LLPSKPILVLAGAALALTAVVACGRGTGDPYGGTAQDPNPLAATGTPGALDAGAAAPGGLEAPVGIPTDKLIATSIPKMGKVVTDAKGWVLYRFDKDTAKPTSATACNGQCAAVWPPVLTDGNAALEGIPRDLVGTLTRDDGSSQLTLAGWPLYRYVGDPKPGAWKGQMVGGTWFVIAPDGKKNITCLPTATPTAATPPGAASANDGGASGGTAGY